MCWTLINHWIWQKMKKSIAQLTFNQIFGWFRVTTPPLFVNVMRILIWNICKNFYDLVFFLTLLNVQFNWRLLLIISRPSKMWHACFIIFFNGHIRFYYNRKLICVKFISNISSTKCFPLLTCSNEATRNPRKVGTHKNKRSKLVCSTSLCHYWRWPLRRFDVVNIKS